MNDKKVFTIEHNRDRSTIVNTQQSLLYRNKLRKQLNIGNNANMGCDNLSGPARWGNFYIQCVHKLNETK